MPRPASDDRLTQLQQTIDVKPGLTIGALARLLGWPIVLVIRILTSLNDKGVLLSEDDNGRIWPFK